MNEVSIIINVVRYDAVLPDNIEELPCESCSLRESCDIQSDGVIRVCCDMIGEEYHFKKSTKSFEK